MSERKRLTVRLSESDGIPVLQVDGEVDLYTVEEFNKALDSGVEKARAALIVDLSKLSYVDSAGLSSLLSAYKRLSARGAELYVISPPDCPGVSRVLKITRLDMLFKVRENLRQALSEACHTMAA